MNARKLIAIGICAASLSACAVYEQEVVQPTLPDDPVGVDRDISLNSIQIGVPSGHRTPIHVVLNVPNACYRFMGGAI